MLHIKLINMPFADVNLSNFALTQLKSTICDQFKERVKVDIVYINHAFAVSLGLDYYENFSGNFEKRIGLEIDHYTDGLRDWFFKKVAFPDEPDNYNEYFEKNETDQTYRRFLLKKRDLIEGFLDTQIKEHDLDKADIIAFTSMFEQQVANIAMARKIKQKNPNSIILFGGANCEHPAYLPLLKIDCIDYCCSGYGITLFTKFIQYFLEGKQDMFFQIPGLHSNQIHQQRIKSGINEENFYFGKEDDINLSTLLDYSDFIESFKKNFSDNNLKPRLFFETSRGCYWGEQNQCCSFCGINRGTPIYRKINQEAAIQYLNHLLSYKENNVFWATDSVMPTDYLDSVFPYLNISPNQRFFYEIRADLNDQQIEKMAKYNINLVQVGIESFDDETLKLMKKGTTSMDNLRVLKKCTEEGIGVLWNLLVGTPGEPENSYNMQFDFVPYIFHFNPPSGVWAISFQKTSEYVNHPEKYGLVLEPNISILEKIYPFQKEDLGMMAYFYSSLSFRKTFTLKNIKKIYQLSHRIEQWKKAWLEKDPPMLYFLSESEILDSRNNTNSVVNIDSDEFKLLQMLTQPTSKTELSLDEKNEKIIELLKMKGLVYQSGDYYFSLVMKSAPKLKTALLPETVNNF